MLKVAKDSLVETPATGAGEPPFERLAGRPGSAYLILCDHARADLPPEYGDLGLPASEFARHIAYDIGARDVAIGLARALGAPALLARYSRLLIDPNRGTDDPTLVMRIADGAVVPANAAAGAGEIARRIERFHAPYHAAIDAAIDEAIAAGTPPALVAIHSFTPRFKNQSRPWHATVLWDRDPRLPVPLFEALAAEPGLNIGENVPYSGRLRGDTMFRHATCRGLAHALIEIRQDLVAAAAGAREWAERLARVLAEIADQPHLNVIVPHGSYTGEATLEPVKEHP